MCLLVIMLLVVLLGVLDTPGHEQMITTEPVALDSPLHLSVELGLQAAALLPWVLCSSPSQTEDNWASRLWLHATCYDRPIALHGGTCPIGF